MRAVEGDFGSQLILNMNWGWISTFLAVVISLIDTRSINQPNSQAIAKLSPSFAELCPAQPQPVQFYFSISILNANVQYSISFSISNFIFQFNQNQILVQIKILRVCRGSSRCIHGIEQNITVMLMYFISRIWYLQNKSFFVAFLASSKALKRDKEVVNSQKFYT